MINYTKWSRAAPAPSYCTRYSEQVFTAGVSGRSYLVNAAYATPSSPDTVLVGDTELLVSRKYKNTLVGSASSPFCSRNTKKAVAGSKSGLLCSRLPYKKDENLAGFACFFLHRPLALHPVTQSITMVLGS